MPAAAVTEADIRHLFGDIDDQMLQEMLSWRPTLTEVREVAAWARNEDDIVIQIAVRNLVAQRYVTY